MNKAIPVLTKLKFLPIDKEAKAKAIRTVVFPAALYGIEAAQLSRSKVAKLSAAIKGVLHTKNSRHDTDLLFAHAVKGRDLDPEVQTVVRRCTMLRRAVEKRPAVLDKIQRIYDSYCKEASGNDLARWHKSEGDGEWEWDPWPHPCSKQKPPVAAAVHSRGPIGNIIEDVIRMDGHISREMSISMPWRML